MQLNIVTPERTVLETEADLVSAKTTDGYVGIKPRHIPLVSPLDIGVLEYTTGGQKHKIAVMGGLLSTDGKSVTILSDAAELGDDIDTTRAEESRKRAEAMLREAETSTTIDKARAKNALDRANLRLKLK